MSVKKENKRKIIIDKYSSVSISDLTPFLEKKVDSFESYGDSFKIKFIDNSFILIEGERLEAGDYTYYGIHVEIKENE